MFLRQFVDNDGVGQRTRDRLVDEQWLAGLYHRNSFLQMNPPVHALEQHHVNFFQQLWNRIDDFDTHSAQLPGEFADAIAAGRNVRAARISGHDSDACVVAGGLRVVEDFRKRGHVRSVQADHAGPERRLFGGASVNPEGQKETEDRGGKPKVPPVVRSRRVHEFSDY